MNERIQQQEKEEQNKENSPPLKQPTKTFPSTTCTPDCSTNFNRSSHIHYSILTYVPLYRYTRTLFNIYQCNVLYIHNTIWWCG